MALLNKMIFVFVFLLGGLVQAETYDFGKTLLKVEGYIASEPRLHVSADGRYVHYSFEFSSAYPRQYGDEYYLANFAVKLWGQAVGEWHYKKGDKINIEGKFGGTRNPETGAIEKGPTGLAGSISVNDFSYEEVFKSMRVPSNFDAKRVQALKVSTATAAGVQKLEAESGREFSVQLDRPQNAGVPSIFSANAFYATLLISVLFNFYLLHRFRSEKQYSRTAVIINANPNPYQSMAHQSFIPVVRGSSAPQDRTIR